MDETETTAPDAQNEPVEEVTSEVVETPAESENVAPAAVDEVTEPVDED